jgi:hypothetical protein
MLGIGLDINVTLPPALADAATAALLALARFLDRAARPRRPGRFTLAVTGQTPGASTMIVTATLPAATASDVASYELGYTIDGGPPVIATSTGDPITFNAPVGSTVVATFIEIDAAGNRSQPSERQTLVVEDVIPPGMPGVFGLAVTGQEP